MVVVKLTNPLHGLYLSAEPVATPFPHLAVDHHLLHWLAMGLAYSLAAVGGFMLFELFAQTGSDTRPLLVLAALTGLPVATSVAGEYSDRVLDMTYEPIGVAAFAVGVLFVYLERFRTVKLAGEVGDSVIVVDESDEIRDSNGHAREGADVDDPLPVSLSATAERSWATVDAPDADLVVVSDLRFLADGDRLRQLFENLFRNSVEHAAADVTVTVGALEGGDGFYVKDDGPGIPERESVFEFGETSTAGGSGLGLAIVATVADAHGWTRRVTRSETGGARFEFGEVDAVRE